MENTNNNEWPDDKLERYKSADFLTKYLNQLYADQEEDIYKDSFVMNVNAGWGFGKTFFIKKWAEDLKKNNHPIVYFDAWENDFSDDPLLAFVSELEDSLNRYKAKTPKAKRIFKKVVVAGKKAIVPTLKLGVDLTAAVLTNGAISDLSFESRENAVEKSIQSHKDKKEAIKNFKEALSELMSYLKDDINSAMPMYVFVDELDRCRPTYAIELLEGIKHIFGVSGIYFIVATNKSQLVHSISAVYGSGFDAATYLRRFFDQEYALPEPNNENYSVYLMEKYRIKSGENIFNTFDRISIAKIFSVLAGSFQLSLRDQEQIVRQIKAITLANQDKNIHIFYLAFLAMYRIKDESAFDIYLNMESTTDIKNHLEKCFDTSLTLTGFRPKDGYGLQSDEIKMIDVIFKYKHYAEKTLFELARMDYLEGTIGGILENIRKEFKNGVDLSKFKSTISSYPELIKQAGQLL